MRAATVIRKSKLRELYGQYIIALDNNLRVSERREVVSIDRFAEMIEGSIVDLAAGCDMVGFKLVNLANSSNYHNVLLPRQAITTEQIQDAIDLLTPKLNELMPGRWHYQGNYLYLAYPELTVKNSNEESHKVYDLVVRIRLNNDGTSDGYLYGDRFSYTAIEMANKYCHSHLPTTGSNGILGGFGAFCVGSGSVFADYLQRLKRGFTAENIEFFLFQLEMYLSWESLEGTPYISLSGLEENPVYEGNFTNLNMGDISLLKRMALSYLSKLTYHLLDSVGDRWVFNPGQHPDRAYAIEQAVFQEFLNNGEMRPGLTYDYNEDLDQYVDGANTTRTLPNHGHGSLPRHLGITPRIIAPEQPTAQSQQHIVKRLGPPALKQLFTELDQLIVNGYKNNV